MAPFAAAAARLLRPGGRAVLHLLAPAAQPWRRRPERRRQPAADGARAGLAAAPPGERCVVIGGQTVRHRLPAAADLYARHFAAGFELRLWYGLGWLWPRRLGSFLPPALSRRLGRLDAALGRWPPCRGRARFYVLDLERRAELPPAL
jgi:hypothetical protein